MPFLLSFLVLMELGLLVTIGFCCSLDYRCFFRFFFFFGYVFRDFFSLFYLVPFAPFLGSFTFFPVTFFFRSFFLVFLK